MKCIICIPRKDTCSKRYTAVTFLSPFSLKQKTVIFDSEFLLAGHCQNSAKKSFQSAAAETNVSGTSNRLSTVPFYLQQRFQALSWWALGTRTERKVRK